MLLKDHSDFLLCFAGTQEPGRRNLSNSNVTQAKGPWDVEKIKTRNLWLCIEKGVG